MSPHKITEVACAVCEGTGMLQVLATQDVLIHGKEILEEVAKWHGLSVAEVVGPSRTAVLMRARIHAAKRLRRETSLTLKAIGLLLGRRDHSTILNLLRTASTAPATKSPTTEGGSS